MTEVGIVRNEDGSIASITRDGVTRTPRGETVTTIGVPAELLQVGDRIVDGGFIGLPEVAAIESIEETNIGLSLRTEKFTVLVQRYSQRPGFHNVHLWRDLPGEAHK